MSDYVIERRWAMPSGATFTIKPIKGIVSNEVFEAYIRANGNAVIIDPFARKSQFGTLTNDINPEYSTDYHMDALDFMREQPDEIADLVLYDPPYSITQAAQLYKSYGKEKLEVNVSNMAYWARLKDEIARVLKRGGGCHLLRMEQQRTWKRAGVRHGAHPARSAWWQQERHNRYRREKGERMKKCDKDRTPCLHEPCLESNGIGCCKDCDFGDTCASRCFKVSNA